MTTTTSHLDSLPPELMDHILSYLFATHAPERSVLATTPPSPLLHLATLSRSLCNSVESFCHTLLRQWSAITKFNDRRLLSAKYAKSHRALLLRWSSRHCVFCGKLSARKAILVTGLRCCTACDKNEWPDKITKTNAKLEYHLNEDHLFAEEGDGWPIINYGTYLVQGATATMFLRSDVERLAQAVHGDWRKHMQDRLADALRRYKKKKDRKAKSLSKTYTIDLTAED